MKSFIIAVAFLVAAAQAVPVHDEPKKNETLVAEVKNATRAIRSSGDCGVSDLDKIQAKITEALEKQIELLLGGHVAEIHNKTRRATSEASAASKVTPDGTIKTIAGSKASNDASTEAPVLTNGHQLPPVDPIRKLPEDSAEAGAPGAPGADEGLPPPPPVAGQPVPTLPPPVPHPEGGNGPAPHPIAGTGNTVQKVASKANMSTGTAVASAIAKRSAVLQNVDTSGAKAVANAEAHKGADTNVQAVTANGTQVGIANALVDNRNASGNNNHSGPEVVLQNVAASGVKAVATATNNKGSGSGIQEALASGDELSIATVSTARAKRALVRIPIVLEEEDDGSYKPERDDQPKILIRQRVSRSPCISTKMDDNLRKLIQDTVAATFADLKKDLKL